MPCLGYRRVVVYGVVGIGQSMCLLLGDLALALRESWIQDDDIFTGSNG
jgi:hypothetical protein